MLVEAGADNTILSNAMCVNKVLHMQRVFLTERDGDSNNSTNIASSAVADEGTEGTDASRSPSSSLPMDTACIDASCPPAAESTDLTLHSQTADVQQMDLTS